MKKLICIIAIILIFIIFYSNNTNAAVVKGTIYGPDFEVLNNAILTVNTQPAQLFISTDGKYQFNLVPGTYIIEARQLEDDLELFSKEEIIITKGEGEFIVDFILLPSTEEDPFFDEFPSFDDVNIKEKNNNATIIVIFVIIIIVVIILYLKKKPFLKKEVKHKEETKEEKQKKEVQHEELSDDLKNLIEILKKKEGRITQKELRKEIPFSEAKVSLMVAELEEKGIIKKIKRGRGNIIILEKKDF